MQKHQHGTPLDGGLRAVDAAQGQEVDDSMQSPAVPAPVTPPIHQAVAAIADSTTQQQLPSSRVEEPLASPSQPRTASSTFDGGASRGLSPRAQPTSEVASDLNVWVETGISTCQGAWPSLGPVKLGETAPELKQLANVALASVESESASIASSPLSLR